MRYYVRPELCKLVGLSDGGFNALAKCQMIPTEGKHVHSMKSADFSAIDVVCFALGEAFRAQIGNEKGLAAESAMRIAGHARDYIERAYQNPDLADLWVGTVATRMNKQIAMKRPKAGWSVMGTFAEIAAQIEQEQKHGEPLRLFLVNVNTVIREVCDRARKARIKFPESLDSDAA